MALFRLGSLPGVISVCFLVSQVWKPRCLASQAHLDVFRYKVTVRRKLQPLGGG